jgi:hypothetical protein
MYETLLTDHDTSLQLIASIYRELTAPSYGVRGVCVYVSSSCARVCGVHIHKFMIGVHIKCIQTMAGVDRAKLCLNCKSEVPHMSIIAILLSLRRLTN